MLRQLNHNVLILIFKYIHLKSLKNTGCLMTARRNSLIKLSTASFPEGLHAIRFLLEQKLAITSVGHLNIVQELLLALKTFHRIIIHFKVIFGERT